MPGIIACSDSNSNTKPASRLFLLGPRKVVVIATTAGKVVPAEA
jgi:hypothetical protein